MAYELASYEPEHREDYLGLLRGAWGQGSMSGEEFDWWFRDNPMGSLMSVAVADEGVVGVAAHSLYRMVLGGREQVASFSVHATTKSWWRGMGIFPRLEQKHEQEAAGQGVAVVLAFASRPTEPIFAGPLGWTRIARLRIWARLFPGRLRKAPPVPGVSQVDRFESSGDAASHWPNHIVRDSRFLNWRYAESPRGYIVHTAPGGYAVLGHKLHRGRRIALIADLVASRDSLRGLIQSCVRATEPGVSTLFAIPAREERSTYAALGFAPTPLSLNFMGKALDGELDTDRAAWRFTLGDTDFF
jgi:hypothetical protein